MNKLETWLKADPHHHRVSEIVVLRNGRIRITIVDDSRASARFVEQGSTLEEAMEGVVTKAS